jgi:hypothetical protein
LHVTVVAVQPNRRAAIPAELNPPKVGGRAKFQPKHQDNGVTSLACVRHDWSKHVAKDYARLLNRIDGRNTDVVPTVARLNIRSHACVGERW